MIGRKAKEHKHNSAKSEDGSKVDTLEEPESSLLKISRGPQPEPDIDFEKLRKLFVYDELDNKLSFTDIFKDQKTIIVFTRHFLDFITKEYVEDLALVPMEYLQEVGVRLVIIGPAPSKCIKPFKELTGFKYTVYCDPDREVYTALGLIETMSFGMLDKSKHIKSGAFMGTLQTMWRAMQYQGYQGDAHQQGGSFIIGPGEAVHFCHVDQNTTDHMNINDMLIEAGVQPVNYPRDRRVITI